MFAPIALILAAVMGIPGPSLAESTFRPPVDAKADYQLGGNYDLPRQVKVVSRDRTAAVAKTAYNVCYVNAYQTQPGKLTWWRDHHPEVLLRRNGDLVHDPGWHAEVLLDTSTGTRRHTIAVVVGRWMKGCAEDGFDAVEPDNLDSFTRSHGLLDRQDNLALAGQLATRAHAAGLAIAQKNLAGLSRSDRLDVGFDFAVAEECSEYSECGAYRTAYGRHVIEIEYSDNGRSSFTRACDGHGDRWSIVYRDRNLRTPSSDKYRYRAC